MRRIKVSFRGAALIATAFAAGVLADRAVLEAHAAAATMAPLMFNALALQRADMEPGPTPPEKMRVLADTDNGFVKLQIGPTSKHLHRDSDEIQVVLEGTGQEWFVDRMVELKPGDVLVLPRGTPHGSLSDNVKILTIQLPPVKAGTTTRLP